MTLKRSPGGIIFQCDVRSSTGCGGEIETGVHDFGSALAVARKEGWHSAAATGGGWLHYCKKCLRPR